MYEASLLIRLDDWRGFSAYEVAVRAGFEGTEEEWLRSLHGADGMTTSVNGIEHIGGNVTLTGADIPVSPGDPRTLSELVKQLDLLMSALRVSETAVDLGGRYIDNAVFR